MEERTDHGAYMESLWNLASVICWVAMLPSYAKKVVLAGSFATPSVRRGIAVVKNMVKAAKQRVAERQRDIKEGNLTRQDLLGKSLAIHHERGEKENYILEDSEVESYTALYTSTYLSAYWGSDES